MLGVLFGDTPPAGLPVFWQVVLAVFAALSGPLAILGQWLWSRWRESQKDRREEELKDHQRTRAERREDENVMIGHLKTINDRMVQDREDNRKEVHSLRNELQAQAGKLINAQIELATLRVMMNRMRDWIRMHERTLDARKIEHPKWEESVPSGSEIHAALTSERGRGE